MNMKNLLVTIVAFLSMFSAANAAAVNPPQEVAKFEVSDVCNEISPCFIMGSKITVSKDQVTFSTFLRNDLNVLSLNIEFPTDDSEKEAHATLTQVEEDVARKLLLSTVDLTTVSVAINHMGDLNNYFCLATSAEGGWSYTQTETQCENLVEFRTPDNITGLCTIGHKIVTETDREGKFFSYLGHSIHGSCFLQK